MNLPGMGAICVMCGAANSTGVRTYEDLKKSYPNGCHVCSRGSKNTPDLLAKKCAELGYDFLDMHGVPIRPGGKLEKKK